MGDLSSYTSDAGLNTGLNMGGEVTASNWIGTGQAAIEAGFKSGGFLIKLEAGYSLYSFHNLEASVYAGGPVARSLLEPYLGTQNNINEGDAYKARFSFQGGVLNNMRVNLSSFYIILGVGFNFGTSL